MAGHTEITFLRRRLAQEQALADAADNELVRQAHYEAMSAYERRIAELDQPSATE